MDFAGLSSILWRERDVLENLLYKLDVQQLLLMAGRSTWLVRASAEIELVLEQVGQISFGHRHPQAMPGTLGDVGHQAEIGADHAISGPQAPPLDRWRCLLRPGRVILPGADQGAAMDLLGGCEKWMAAGCFEPGCGRLGRCHQSGARNTATSASSPAKQAEMVLGQPVNSATQAPTSRAADRAVRVAGFMAAPG